MKVSDYSAMRIINLSRKAQKGDSQALNELQRLNVYLVNNITRRKKTIDKQGLNSPAYNRFISEIQRQGIEAPTKSKKLSIQKLELQVLAARKFLEAKTGTAKGIIQYEKEELKRLEDKGIILSAEEFRTQWKDFIESDIVQEYKEFDSERTLIEGFEAIKQGKTLEDLKAAWKDYQSGERSLPEAWNQFVTV